MTDDASKRLSAGALVLVLVLRRGVSVTKKRYLKSGGRRSGERVRHGCGFICASARKKRSNKEHLLQSNALESVDAVRITREFLGQNLDCDVTLQFRIAGTINLAHAAFSKQGPDFVQADLCANGDGQD
jgi:hypothetical protein